MQLFVPLPQDLLEEFFWTSSSAILWKFFIDVNDLLGAVKTQRLHQFMKIDIFDTQISEKIKFCSVCISPILEEGINLVSTMRGQDCKFCGCIFTKKR